VGCPRLPCTNVNETLTEPGPAALTDSSPTVWRMEVATWLPGAVGTPISQITATLGVVRAVLYRAPHRLAVSEVTANLVSPFAGAWAAIDRMLPGMDAWLGLIGVVAGTVIGFRGQYLLRRSETRERAESHLVEQIAQIVALSEDYRDRV
jgi:hypothetical protein